MKKILLLYVCLSGLLYAQSQAGKLDPSFAGKGWTYMDFGYAGNVYDEIGQQVLLQNDGTYILVFGVNDSTRLARYHSNGTLDSSFHGSGFSAGVQIRNAKAVLQHNGKIVVAGGGNNQSTYYDFALARFNTDGSLDSSFGRNGMQTTDFEVYDFVTSIAVQGDDKIVVAGSTQRQYTSDPSTGGSDFALARYNRDGFLDSSFDKDGKVVTDFEDGIDAISSLAVQEDGKIVAVGYTTLKTDIRNVALARYNRDGSLDKTFDTDGKLTTRFSEGNDYSDYFIALQSDAKIVIAGSTFNLSNTPSKYDFALARFTPDGSLDSSFGLTGRVTTDFKGRSDFAASMAVQSNDKIVIAGFSFLPNDSNEEFALARYNRNGSLDSSFDADGMRTTDFAGVYNRPASVIIQRNGKVVVAGTSYHANSTADFVLARYNKNGSLDKIFDRDGKLAGYYPVKTAATYAVAIQRDGKLIVAGGASGPNTGTLDFALARYNRDGSLDKTFEGDGLLTTDFAGGNDKVASMALQADGKIVVAGSTVNLATDNVGFALARYNPDGSLDSTFDQDGKLTTVFLKENGMAASVAIQTDGKIVVAGTIEFFQNIYDRTTVSILTRYNSDGSLDKTFGKEGTVRSVTVEGEENYEYATSLAIQPDGKIVVTGSSNFDFFLARYQANGSPDSSFGVEGKLVGGVGTFAYGRAITIQKDGKLVVAGNVSNSDYIPQFLLVRCNRDGSLDSSFDGDGRVTTAFGEQNDVATSLAVQGDGKIVVAGETLDSSHRYDFAIARYKADGSLDSAFGVDGKRTTDFGGNDIAYASAMYQNRLYVAGSSSNLDQREKGVVAAYLLSCTEQVFYKDRDRDGYGDITEKVRACTTPVGYVADSTDCNDTSAAIHPGAHEICDNGIDDNCDGQIDEDCPSAPLLTINDKTVYESEGVATLTVSLTRKADHPVYLLYFTVDGTAQSLSWYNKDYKATWGVLTIPAGSQTGTITIPIYKDNIQEGDEYFDVYLFHPLYAAQGYEKGRVTIKDGAPNQTTSPITQGPALEQRQISAQTSATLSVQAYPNPSASGFTLTLKSSDSNPVALTVRDALGRVLEVKQGLLANTTIQIGHNYRPGVYYAELTQGRTTVTFKLVKQLP